MFKYPHGDLHGLNLDWFLEQFRKMQNAFTGSFTADVTPVAPTDPADVNVSYDSNTGVFNFDFELPAGVTPQSYAIGYQASASGTTIPTGTWLASPPAVNQGDYLWTQTTVTYNNGFSYSSYTCARMGVDGLGSVITVNNLPPDLAGNIDLDASNIIAPYNNKSVDDNIELARKLIKRNFILLGDSFSIGYTTTDGVTYTQSEWGWANKAKTLLQGFGHEAYDSNDVGVHIPGNTGFSSSLKFETLLGYIGVEVPDKEAITDIIVLGGTNDIGFEANIDSDIESFVSYCKTNYPNAEISVGVIGSDIYNLNTNIAPHYKHILKCGGKYINDTLNMFGDNSKISVDGTHLTASGYQYYFPSIFEAIINGSCWYAFPWTVNLTPSSANASDNHYHLSLLATPHATYVYFESSSMGSYVQFNSAPSSPQLYSTTGSAKIRVPQYYGKLGQAIYWAANTSQQTMKWGGELYPYVTDTTIGSVTSSIVIPVGTVTYYYVKLSRTPVPIFVN